MTKINLTGNTKIEGNADIDINYVICVCGNCGNQDNKNARIEINFMEQKLLYICSSCKKENCIVFKNIVPYPKTSMRK